MVVERQDTHSKGVHLTIRPGRRQKPVLLPSVQRVSPYLAVLSTFSTADIVIPLPSCTSYHMPCAPGHAEKLLEMYLELTMKSSEALSTFQTPSINIYLTSLALEVHTTPCFDPVWRSAEEVYTLY